MVLFCLKKEITRKKERKKKNQARSCFISFGRRVPMLQKKKKKNARDLQL